MNIIIHLALAVVAYQDNDYFTKTKDNLKNDNGCIENFENYHHDYDDNDDYKDNDDNNDTDDNYNNVDNDDNEGCILMYE